MFQEDIKQQAVHLVSEPYNPIPGNPRSGMVEVEVGVFIRYAIWRAQKASGKGTILLLQGRTEFIEKNYELVGDLVNHGYDVLAFDWRGQGGSSRLLEDRRAGYVDSFDEYVTDLKQVIFRVALPDCRAPYNILAHSTGSLVALKAAPELETQIERMVFCSPLFGLNNQKVSQGVVKFFSGLLTAGGLGAVRLSGRRNNSMREEFEGNIYTSDPERFERNGRFAEEHPHIGIDGPTASWVYAACRAIEELRDSDFLSSVNIPTLIINAGNDTVVDNRAAEFIATRLRLGSFVTVTGARHEMWHERDIYREQLLAAFAVFLTGSD